MATDSTPSPLTVQPKTASRLLFVDNIRVFLTILVLLHHLMVIYAGTGSWLYSEGRQDEITQALGAWFCTVNQGHFMGLFLLISACFVPSAYDRKGGGRFLADRLIRLGIPLAVYGWIIRPLFVFATLVANRGVAFWEWFPGRYFGDYGIIGGGPLWFIETLLIFSAAYVLWRLLTRARAARPAAAVPFPSSGVIALAALLIAAATFLVRVWFPQDTRFRLLNLQFANFAQYIALFVIGLLAYRRNWLVTLPEATGRRWLAIGVLLILLFPPLAFATGAANDNLPFKGGWHWQSLTSALWESFLCLSLCIGLIYAFRRRANREGRLGRFLAPNAYTAYLIHEPIITAVALAAQAVALYPLLKFGLAALVTVPLCFAVSSLIRKLPYTNRVL